MSDGSSAGSRVWAAFAAGAVAGGLLVGWLRAPTAVAADAEAVLAMPPTSAYPFQLVPVGNQYFMVIDGRDGQVWKGHIAENGLTAYTAPRPRGK